jgi:hypothetical protein
MPHQNRRLHNWKAFRAVIIAYHVQSGRYRLDCIIVLAQLRSYPQPLQIIVAEFLAAQGRVPLCLEAPHLDLNARPLSCIRVHGPFFREDFISMDRLCTGKRQNSTTGQAVAFL